MSHIVGRKKGKNNNKESGNLARFERGLGRMVDATGERDEGQSGSADSQLTNGTGQKRKASRKVCWSAGVHKPGGHLFGKRAARARAGRWRWHTPRADGPATAPRPLRYAPNLMIFFFLDASLQWWKKTDLMSLIGQERAASCAAPAAARCRWAGWRSHGL